jgi:signal transduction histidine kinase
MFEWARRRVGHGQTLETLIAAAAHDIRSPLTAMKGFGYALERHWDRMDEAQRALMLAGIVYDADRMDHILRLLVDAARIAAGGLDLFPEQTDLRDAVEQVAAALARDPEHPPVLFSGDPGPFFVDPTRLRTAVRAFVEALVWWGSGGPITCSAERTAGVLEFRAARAAGPDLDGAAAEALFAARRAGTGGGSKIGLYVVRGLAEAQGGRAWSTVEDGVLTFHLELPPEA